MNGLKRSAQIYHPTAGLTIGQTPGQPNSLWIEPDTLLNPGVRFPVSKRDRISDRVTLKKRGEAAPASAQPLALDKNANIVARGGKQHQDDEHRRERTKRKQRKRGQVMWGCLNTQWEHSTLPRVQKCRRVSVAGGGRVGVRMQKTATGGRMVGYSGLATCGSVWACPLCCEKIQARRRLELKTAMETAEAMSYALMFVTTTLRHNSGQSLQDTLDMLRAVNRAIAQDRTVRKLRRKFGFIGYVRAIEVTHGEENGWHPHSHACEIFERRLTTEERIDLKAAEYRVILRVTAETGYTPLPEFFDRRDVTSADEAFSRYFAKTEFNPRSLESTAYELSGTTTKSGKNGNRQPFEILYDFDRLGEVDDLELWNEYEQATRGCKALNWSRGLKQLLRVEEQTDEEIAAEEVGDEQDTVFIISDWAPIRRNTELGHRLLVTIEIEGVAAGERFCHEHGIPIEPFWPGDDAPGVVDHDD